MDGDNDMVTKPEIRELLRGASYPASRQDLIDYAMENGADEADVDLLRDLPDVQYESWGDVDEALGTPTEEEE